MYFTQNDKTLRNPSVCACIYCRMSKNFFGTKPKSIIKTDAMQRNAVSKSGIDLLIVLISLSDRLGFISITLLPPFCKIRLLQSIPHKEILSNRMFYFRKPLFFFFSESSQPCVFKKSRNGISLPQIFRFSAEIFSKIPHSF